MAPAELAFDYRDHFGQTTAPAYERLLLDATSSATRHPLRARRGGWRKASWRFVDALTAAPGTARGPAAGRVPGRRLRGPDGADELFRGCEGGWSRGQV